MHPIAIKIDTQEELDKFNELCCTDETAYPALYTEIHGVFVSHPLSDQEYLIMIGYLIVKVAEL